MDFKLMQEKLVENAVNYCQRHNITLTSDWVAIKMMEEVGEMAQALLIHQKKSRPSKFVDTSISKKELGKEIADVIGFAAVLAELHDIDLDDAIDKKWIHKED